MNVWHPVAGWPLMWSFFPPSMCYVVSSLQHILHSLSITIFIHYCFSHHFFFIILCCYFFILNTSCTKYPTVLFTFWHSYLLMLILDFYIVLNLKNVSQTCINWAHSFSKPGLFALAPPSFFVLRQLCLRWMSSIRLFESHSLHTRVETSALETSRLM